MDDDVTETLRAHEEEMAEFDAALYPKPWGEQSVLRWLMNQIDDYRLSRVGHPARIRCTSHTLKAIMMEDMGSRRFVPLRGDHDYHVFGVPLHPDESLPRYKVIIEP